MKKKEEQLVRKVTDMIQKTREGKLHWDIQCQTTEYNDPAKKPVETEEGETWVIDECFVSYHCMDQMLVYEVHMLWLAVLEQYKKDPQSMELDVTGRELVLQ